MTSQIIAEVSRAELNDTISKSPAAITQLELLGSYNWLDHDIPTILVPGSPSLWSPPKEPLKLKPDYGRKYIDQNAARSPGSPLEPLLRTLFAQHPDFNIDSVDLVTDRNNIRKLLRFVKNISCDPFNIRVEIVNGRTALFTRVEDHPTEVVRGQRGYGHNFEHAYTIGMKGCSGHHRIVGYRFCDLHCVVRYETDGYVDDDDSGHNDVKKEIATAGSLLSSMQNLQLSEQRFQQITTSKLKMKREGKEVAQSSILEIKTRPMGKPPKMSEVYSQLWISQTPLLAIGYHENGLFSDIRLKDMTQAVHDWEEGNQEDLRKLGALLRQIITTVRNSVCSIAVVKYSGRNKLNIVGTRQQKVLPEDLYARWKAEHLEPTQRMPFMMKIKGADQTPSQQQPKTPIMISGMRYELDMSQMPGLGLLVQNQTTSSIPTIHEVIPHFDIALKGIERGYGFCFGDMTCDILYYRTLCNTYELLGVTTIDAGNIQTIMQALRIEQRGYQPRRAMEARDTAFKLIYAILKEEAPDEKNAKRNDLFNAVLYVASHQMIFRPNIRKAVRLVFDSQFTLTEKQTAILDQCQFNNTSGQSGGNRKSNAVRRKDSQHDQPQPNPSIAIPILKSMDNSSR